MPEALKIVLYPDPRLKKQSTPITDFTPALSELAQQMFALMREAKGVGLAAPQVGQNIRMFVMNATGKPEDDRVYINPVLSDAEGDMDEEEGCLSIPELRVKVWRAKSVRIQATDLTGQLVDQTDDDFVARVWQHETDHLNGILLTDRMGAVAKIANRGLLRDLEAKFKKKK
ncbi:MAG TPA: peptide deformylase [Tepidisphaeraceae bacterium]|jgi:peptide deformylase|nr:peptide deformylase [Tepidisphaeraceae bacterium]